MQLTSPWRADFPGILALAAEGQTYLDSAATAQKPQAMQKNSMTILWHRERISILPAPYCPMQTGQDRYPSASASFSCMR